MPADSRARRIFGYERFGELVWRYPSPLGRSRADPVQLRRRVRRRGEPERVERVMPAELSNPAFRNDTVHPNGSVCHGREQREQGRMLGFCKKVGYQHEAVGQCRICHKSGTSADGTIPNGTIRRTIRMER